MNIYDRTMCPVCGKQHAQTACPTSFGEQLGSKAAENVAKPLADFINKQFVDRDTTIAELRKEISTLTEQLRLANEDAERLAEYVGHKRTCTWAVVRSDVTPQCACKLSNVMYLHKKRIIQESE